MNSSERVEEITREHEGYRWDAVLPNETWRPAKSDIWRHIRGTSSWEQEHIRTNTGLEFY